MQLDTGDDLCVYQVARKDPADPGVPHGYLARAGGTHVATSTTITPYGSPWGVGYPLQQRVELTFPGGQSFDLNVQAVFNEQRRVPTGKAALPYVTLWEGAASVLDHATNAPQGRAFLELAGYG
jgi:hypothetical protein